MPAAPPPGGTVPSPGTWPAAGPAGGLESTPAPPSEPILCRHCGRTATNGISCEGMCVADSGY